MRAFALSALATLAAFFPSVTALPASPLAVAVVTEQFKNALLVPNVLPTFNPTGLLFLNYTITVGPPAVGQALGASNLTTDPQVAISGTAEGFLQAGSPYNNTASRYTVITIDASYPGSSNAQGYNIHWLVNNATYGSLRDDIVLLNLPAAVVDYAPPAPPARTGPHRYVTLIYLQPDSFTAPSTPAPGSSVVLFNLTEYVTAAGLGQPFAGTYFTVEEGAATVSVSQTSAVDNTTITVPQYSSTSTFTPTSSSSSSAPSPTAGSSGASSRNAAGVLAVAAAFVGAVVLA